MSGASFVGMAGAGYSSGIAVYSYEYMAGFILVVFIFFLLPFYIRTGVFTMPEFLERRFDRRSRYCFAALLIFLSIFLDCAGALYAGGLVVQTIYPDIPLWVGVTILALLAAVLSVFGGLGAVVVSDTIQAVVLIIGGVIIFFAAWAAIPSWEAVEQAAPANALNIIQPIDDPFLPWPGLFGVFIIGVYFWTTNQLIVQRTLGAKTLDHGRWGAIFAGFLKLPPLFIMILPGVMAIPLYPDLDTPDLAFPTLAFDLLPIGLRGVILAALVAAITSTVDSILNSASTLVTMDFVRPLRPSTSDRALVFIGRVTTAVVTLIGILWAPQIINFPSLWNYFQSILAYATPAIVAIFFVGVFWRGATATAAFLTFVIGLGLGVAGFILIEIGGAIELHFLYATIILFFIALALMIGISRVTERKPSEDIDSMIWTTAIWKAESQDLAGKPIWLNYRYQALVLVLCTAGIVIWWW
jgi:SSS family solute:Na+ symporter